MDAWRRFPIGGFCNTSAVPERGVADRVGMESSCPSDIPLFAPFHIRTSQGGMDREYMYKHLPRLIGIME
jgi:hypothetical protein